MNNLSGKSSDKVKILVAYHKKDTLYKNEILVPIHCGRTVAYAKSKDGFISEEDYNWLVENLIGDDSGDNISSYNRALNEMTAIYWGWKNYDKLENPEYIGFSHYRRLINLTGGKINHSDVLASLGYDNQDNITNIFKDYDIIAQYLDFTTVNSTFETIEDYVNAVDLKNKHAGMYNAFLRFREKKGYYSNNIFIMKKEDFFEYCNIMFNLLLSAYDEFLKNDDERINTRFLACCSEFLTGFYIDYLVHDKGYKVKNLKLYDMISFNDRKKKFLRNFINNIFSVRNPIINNEKSKMLTIMGIKFFLPFQKVKK